MKEIIEKYKNGKLRIKDCSSRIQFKDSDVIRNVYNDKYSREPIENCVTDEPVGINNCNTNLGYTNPNYFVEGCLAIDKMISEECRSKSEKPKQYKYEKADYAESWRALRDLSEGQKFYRELDGTYYEASHVQEVLSLYINDALLVKVEVTQEDLEAQKAEELAELLRKEMLKCTYRKDEALAAAKKALEWMRQEG